MLKINETEGKELNELVDAIIEAEGCALDEALDIVERSAFVFYKNMTGVEVVEEILYNDLIKIPDYIRDHIDLESIWNTLKKDGYTEVSNGIIRLD